MNDIILSNNRFLGKTNPTMAAAVADGGSVLDREYIQRCARQMVDMGIWSDCFGWWDDGLVETRDSGGNLYVPKSYDLRGGSYDAEQTTEALQPLLTATGMQFADTQYIGNTGVNVGLNGSAVATIQFWVYPTSFSSDRNYCFLLRSTSINLSVSFMFSGSTGLFLSFLRSQASDTVQIINSASGTTGTLNAWQMITVVADVTNKWLKIYQNTTKVAERTGMSALSSDTFVTSSQLNFIMGYANTAQSLVGKMRDIRFYKIAQSEAQIAAIYNLTNSIRTYIP